MVELAKAADGPAKLALYVVASGVLVGGAAVAIVGPAAKQGANRVYEATRDRLTPSVGPKSRLSYVVTKDVEAGNGLFLVTGEQFLVLAQIEGGVLIRVLGKRKNPWMVSSHCLEEASAFRVNPVDN